MNIAHLKSRGIGSVPLVFIFVITILLAGCPRFAHVELYNNTTETLTIYVADIRLEVRPGETTEYEFTSHDFKLESSLGGWNYARKIPHSGEDGPFFEGTLRLQVNSDGRIYALKASDQPPLLEVREQPAGYPLHPD